ncbi:hypothetical protein CK247_27635 [Klebsiella pneumoniae]|nr:hypothetical protein CK247_27635 [Klebsiella pneumoniae]
MEGAKKNRHMTGGKSMLAWIDCVLHFSQTDKLYLSTFAAEVSMLNFNKASRPAAKASPPALSAAPGSAAGPPRRRQARPTGAR